MQIIKTCLDDVLIISHDPIQDERGHFVRNLCVDYLERNNIDFNVKQVSTSFNIKKHTLRGMHFQREPEMEKKIIQCMKGKIFDVVVDIRENSPTYLKHYSIILEENDNKSLFVGKGFAHGFQTLLKDTEVMYHIDRSFSPKHASGILWNDPVLNISWPQNNPTISQKDKNWYRL